MDRMDDPASEDDSTFATVLFTEVGAVLRDPFGGGTHLADVPTLLFTLDPLVAQNLVDLGFVIGSQFVFVHHTNSSTISTVLGCDFSGCSSLPIHSVKVNENISSITSLGMHFFHKNTPKSG